MKNLVNTTFFNFLLGFFAILATSLCVIMVANYYELTLHDAQQAASAFLFGRDIHE